MNYILFELGIYKKKGKQSKTQSAYSAILYKVINGDYQTNCSYVEFAKKTLH